MVALTAKAGDFTRGATNPNRPHKQFTCVTSNFPVKTGKFVCFYAATTSPRLHATARNEARKLRVISPSGCRLTHLQLAGDLTHAVTADCLQLRVFLPAKTGSFA